MTSAPLPAPHSRNLHRLLSLAEPHPAERDLDTLLTAVERFLDPSAERFAKAYRELRETAVGDAAAVGAGSSPR